MDGIDALDPQDMQTPREARFSTVQYYRISDSGALDAYAKTELHDGRIVVVNAQYVPHARVKGDIAFALRDSIRTAALPLLVLIEADVEIAEGEVLQPDITLCDLTSVKKGLPVAQARLMVEVAVTTETIDLGRKRLRYAAAGVPEYWVAILATERFERFCEPEGGDYRRHDSLAFEAGCTSLTLPGVMVPPATIRS